MVRHSIIIGALFISISSCSKDVDNQIYPYTELAVMPGMIIESTNRYGTISIEATSELKRRYKWDDKIEDRVLIPRKNRWLGLLGAYDPASRFFWEFWKTSPRIVAEDSQLHFNDISEMETFLINSDSYADWSYTDRGLVVGYFITPERDQVNIEVYQIYINDVIPSNVPMDIVDQSSNSVRVKK